MGGPDVYRAAAEWSQGLIDRWLATGGVPLEIAIAMMEDGRDRAARMGTWTHHSFKHYGLLAACRCGCRERLRRRYDPDLGLAA